MTDPTPYRSGRDERPAEGPGQRTHDAKSSLPPGAKTKPDLGGRGDVDRAMPYEGDPSPGRMVDQPFSDEEPDSGGDAVAKDVTTMIEQEHRQFEQLFERIRGGGDEGITAAQELVRGLSLHAFAEEIAVYPKVQEEVEEGEPAAAHAREEHQAIKEALLRLDQGLRSDSIDTEALDDLVAEVTHHVGEEEGEVLPALRRAVGTDGLAELADAFEDAKGKAPTRPHPHAPDTPPGEVVAGVMAKPLDRTRDAIEGRPRD